MENTDEAQSTPAVKASGAQIFIALFIALFTPTLTAAFFAIDILAQVSNNAYARSIIPLLLAFTFMVVSIWAICKLGFRLERVEKELARRQQAHDEECAKLRDAYKRLAEKTQEYLAVRAARGTDDPDIQLALEGLDDNKGDNA